MYLSSLTEYDLIEKKESEFSVHEEGAPPEMLDGEQNRHFLGSLIVVAKRKFSILSVVSGVAVLSAMVSLFLPKYYTATTKMLPPQQSQLMASAMLSQLGHLGPLGAGKDLGIRNPSDMYLVMLRSRTVADSLVDRFSLTSVYHAKLCVDARVALESATEIVAGKEGVISIAVQDRDGRRATDLANAYVVELEKLTRTLAVTDAAKRKLFFEQEVKTANEELAAAPPSV